MTKRPRTGRVKAQAKVNLFLRVGPRLTDGYHDLLTLFHRIDLSDDVSVRVGGSERTLTCSGPSVPRDGLGRDDKNLAMRAAASYAEARGWPDGFHIELNKHIPVGGGLGGGSADAAAVLRILDVLSERPLGPELPQLARSLGADVPFLASDRVASFAGGRGDEPLFPELTATSLQPRDVILLLPPFGVDTASAYRWLDESDRQFESSGALTGFGWGWENVERVSLDLRNDFEPVVEERHPVIRACRERLLQAGARIARMSGSGSTVFGVFDRPAGLLASLPDGVRQSHTRTAARVVQVEARE